MESVASGGRGIAFASVVIGSLLSAAYSASSLAVVVSPQFMDVVNGRTDSVAQLPGDGSDGADAFASQGGTWLSVLALFIIWSAAAVLSWRFMSAASFVSRAMLPLPLLLWCVLAVFAASVVDDRALFRFLLVPNAAALRQGRLWANAAGQSLLLLQVGTGVTITFGSKAKAVHSVVNVSTALLALALLYAFFVTVSSAGSLAIVSVMSNATAPPYALGGNYSTSTTATPFNFSSSATSTATSWTPQPTSDANSNASLAPAGATRQFVFRRLPVLLPALFGAGGAGARVLGVLVYIVAIAVGVFAITLVLSSLYSSLSDFHVALRSPLTVAVAALACFGIGAPMTLGAVPGAVVVALDQAVVGTCLPVVVCAESVAFAFGGWGGPSVIAQLGAIAGEDIAVCGKALASFDLLRTFGAGRFRDLLGPENLRSTHGRIIASLLPAFLKLVVPVTAVTCALVTLVSFAQSQQTPAARAVYGVVVAVFFALFVAGRRSTMPPPKQLPWAEMGTSDAAAPTAADAWEDDERAAQ